MRKYIVILFSLLSLGVYSQNINKFLDDYQAFINKVQKIDFSKLSEKEFLEIDSVYRVFTKDYHDTYKLKMSDEELSKYIELRTLYKKKIVRKNAKEMAVELDSVGVKIGKEMKRTGSRISGFIKGSFIKKKN